MSWNYRIVKHSACILDEDVAFYSIHEAFYDEKGNPLSISEDGICPQGDDIEELKSALALMQKALDKPVLNYEDF